jgi:hypothetical protein
MLSYVIPQSVTVASLTAVQRRPIEALIFVTQAYPDRALAGVFAEVSGARSNVRADCLKRIGRDHESLCVKLCSKLLSMSRALVAFRTRSSSLSRPLKDRIQLQKFENYRAIDKIQKSRPIWPSVFIEPLPSGYRRSLRDRPSIGSQPCRCPCAPIRQIRLS